MQRENVLAHPLGSGILWYYIGRYSLEAGSKLRYYYSQEKFDPGSSVLYYRNPCYYSEYLNRAILLMRDMHIHELIDDRYDVISQIKALLAKTYPTTDYGLIELRHLGTAAKIIGGVCLAAHIDLIVEIIYKYIKEKLENAN